VSRRALVIHEPGSLAIVERDGLVPGAGEVVLRPAYCGLCGTDLELLRGEVDPEFARYPLTLGHEWSGVVEAVGAGVRGLEPGLRCVAEGIIPCGRCASCRAGATNVCDIFDEVGFTREGGAGDQIAVPARIVHVLDDTVPLLDAALVEPSAVVLTGLEKARLRPGLRVLVVGDGTIALLSVLLASLWSPVELVVAGRRAEQEELARELGATGFGVGSPPAGFDLAIEGLVDHPSIEHRFKRILEDSANVDAQQTFAFELSRYGWARLRQYKLARAARALALARQIAGVRSWMPRDEATVSTTRTSPLVVTGSR